MAVEMKLKLPRTVIEQDHALENSAEGATRALMELRWHWTLDESNPGRVALREYARQVGRGESVIRADASGFALLQDARRAPRSPEEARRRSMMSAETQAAVEAVAEARGLEFGYANREYRNEAVRVRETARQRAEEKGTSTLDEIPHVAAFTHKAEVASRTSHETRREKHTLRYLSMEARLIKARRHLLGALQESEGVDFDSQERELLHDTIDNVKKLLALLDRAIADQYDKSWVTELRVIEGGIAS